MKLALILLAVLNVALLSAWGGLFGPIGGDAREPQRLSRQVRPEQLRVVSANEPGSQPAAGAASVAPPAPPAASASAMGPATPSSPVMPAAPLGVAPAATATPASPGSGSASPPGAAGAAALPAAPAAPASPAASAPAATVCTEWGPFTETDVQDARAAAEQAGLRVEPLARASEPRKYMVHLPPFADQQAAQARASELKQMGIETYVIRDGPHRLGVSLGIFRQEDGAQAMLRELSQRGVTDAQIAAPRNDRWVLQLFGAGPLPSEQRRALAAQFPQRRFRGCSG